MGEKDQRTGVSRRRARLRHLVVRGEAMMAAAALLLLVGPFEIGPRPDAGQPLETRGLDPAWSRVPPGAPSARVAVIGDSLISESRNEQRSVLEARGYPAVVAGSRAKAMGTPWVQAQVDAVAADPRIEIVVLATAANDNFENAARAFEAGDRRALAEYRAVLTETLSRLGDRCVVLVDARDVATGWFAPGYAPKSNAVLREVAAGRAHTEVVGWSDISRPHRGDWFAEDMEHFGGRGRQAHPTGAAAYAEAIADGVDRCAASS